MLGAPCILTSRALGGPQADAASERIGLAVIGTRNMGGSHLGVVVKMRQFDLRACCDVDKKVLANALATVERQTSKQARGLGDFRHVLDAKDIDAVIIATPDHWHALMAVMACQAGKDVYCEKPLSLTIREGRRMVEAARRYGRVFQTGSQHRSKLHTRLACELVRNGRIGKVHTIITNIPGCNWTPPPVPDGPAPPELDYDLWLGPAPYRPYNEKRVHYVFRFFWDYSGGQMTNFGHHANDLAQWGNGSDDTGPISAEGTAQYEPNGWYEVPMKCEATLEYANGAKLVCRTGAAEGALFEGEKGKIHCGYGKMTTDPPQIAHDLPRPEELHLYRSTHHHVDWAECIKSRARPIADVETGHRSVTVCHLANIAIRMRRRIRWDPEKEEILGDDEAARMLDKPYRQPWTL
jgi:predicted dehydrogenase